MGVQERKGLEDSTHTVVFRSDRLEPSCPHAGERLPHVLFATALVKECRSPRVGSGFLE